MIRMAMSSATSIAASVGTTSSTRASSSLRRRQRVPVPHPRAGLGPEPGPRRGPLGRPRDWRGRRLPALAAEVVSRGSITRDYQAKREEYLAYGLLEYWIVDPLERKVTVLTRRGDTWSEAVFRGDQVIASLVLPGFATTVAELWVGVDDAEDDDDAADDGGGANGA